MARALASRPAIVFADEPTGNLDSRSGSRDPRRSCGKSVDDFGQTIVMVTHDPSAASYADRVLFLADGRVVDEMTAPTADLGPGPHAGPRDARGGCLRWCA